MLLISHRGNISGRNTERENTPQYIEEALNLGYWVEVDIWEDTRGKLRFGHDCYSGDLVSATFFANPMILFHCKNFGALRQCKERYLHFFFHKDDFFTLSSKGWIISHSQNKPASRTIHMLPEKNGYSKESLKDCAGICSDFIAFYA